MKKLTLQDLESKLWSCADILRGELSAAQYMDYIFGLLFLKRLNDQFKWERKIRYKEFKKRKIAEEEIMKFLNDPSVYETFYIPEQARWDNLRNLSLNIGSELDRALRVIEDEPKNSEISGVLTILNYNDRERVPDKKLSQLLHVFDSMNLSNEYLESEDILGDAYQYLIKKFADEGGAKGGEFYTPTEVVKVMVNLLKPEEGDKIYDPTCGSGGMLIQSIEYIKEQGENYKNVYLYGQEINLSTWAICKMNMLLHGVKEADIQKGDTIRDPKHTEGGVLKSFDKVIANPPFSLKNWGLEEAGADQYYRFSYGMPPKSYGDMAFVSHMVASLNTNGRMASVVPNGVLFRGGAENKIRENFLKDDLIEAVIELPQNIFYGTGIPAAVLVINKNKEEKRKNKVLFIDASQNFIKDGNKNKLRDEDIRKITETFDEYRDVEKYSGIVDMDIIKENDYNLNISRYVDTTEPEPEVDIDLVLEDIRELKMDMVDTEYKLNWYLEEMGFDTI
ncbi:MAG: type I restriction-modification system subunit M [Clostridium sp.]|uniref:type I restriction-modification system subunit M n=1 Tax=Clostridium sp. TaxID=1506 RepID=UPI0025BE62D7|nr:type I restriction-modification system subunit M [Clostridium sp.]MCH3963052.1 type I restriction-modification system subunit M [Clostridium sp.]MCI1716485.1 type I restriction-modification system subunit M [Clostridium sp.]MCI1800825.1 type I restriction-modification system subunit M [Clostridium sp.]MCI1814520.1 type I restriction-modification system subunit M [Clostridium sp.]MCI1871430.1 type I restriction-modification system subunit M [Clostridium sp.]